MECHKGFDHCSVGVGFSLASKDVTFVAGIMKQGTHFKEIKLDAKMYGNFGRFSPCI